MFAKVIPRVRNSTARRRLSATSNDRLDKVPLFRLDMRHNQRPPLSVAIFREASIRPHQAPLYPARFPTSHNLFSSPAPGARGQGLTRNRLPVPRGISTRFV